MKKKNVYKGSLVIVLLISLFGVYLSGQSKDISGNSITDYGENDRVMNALINATLNGSSGDSFQQGLNSVFSEQWVNFTWASNNAWKWDGTVANLAKDATNLPSTNPAVIPEDNIDGFMEVYSGQQLAYALDVTNNVNRKILLKKDIDLNGQEKAWIYSYKLPTGFIFDGGDFTIYNLGGEKPLIESLDAGTLKNITFDSVKIVSDTVAMIGVVGNYSDGTKGRSTVDHVRVQNSLFFSAYPTYNPITKQESYTAPLGEAKYLNASYVATSNNIIYALKAHVGGAFGVTEKSSIDNSYSVDSTVIAGGNHSGGFISCSNGDLTVENSFTNNNVYGYKETGVFIGEVMENYTAGNKGASFTNCYASGSIEGVSKLGGFIGSISANGSADFALTFTNCYSTSIVGMQAGGNYLGGFVGSISPTPITPVVFQDCYAAGEVGSTDTNLDVNRTDFTTVGGFLGSIGNIDQAEFVNCYYDKQTTAMREWESGTTRDNVGETASDTNNNNIIGLKGVLTSNSEKFGAGIASQPIAAADPNNTDGTFGFTGFVGDVAQGNGISTNANWLYDGGNTNPALHNCMYPQLNVFYESADAFVRAFSYASVATVHEQVWDYCTHNQKLANTTYDTVRDLTLRFTMTSYVDNMKDPNALIEWQSNDTKTSLYNKTLNVINYLKPTMSSKYNREYYTADKFAPGTEWLTVSFTLSDANGNPVVGTRALRIIPTTNINVGNDQLDLLLGSTYNHAKDMYMAYSTAKRMAANPNDVTTGVYPDALPFDTSDPRTQIQNVSGAIQTQFGKDDNNFIVGGEHLTGATRQVDDAHPNNIINTYLYKVNSFEEKNGMIEIKYYTNEATKKDEAMVSPDKLKAGDTTAEEWAKKLNGETAFEKGDEGRYLIEYEWIVPDGRYMRDSKLLLVQEGEHDVAIDVYNEDGTLKNDTSLALNMNNYKYTESTPVLTFKDASDHIDTTVAHFTPVNLGFKLKSDTATITKLEFKVTTQDLDSSAKEVTVTLDNVVDGATIEIPARYVYVSYEEGGKYFAKVVDTIRTYTLHYDSAKEYYYLTLDSKFNDSVTGLERFDVQSEVQINLYVKDVNAVKEGTVSITNQTFEDKKQNHIADQFTYRVSGPNNYVHDFTLNSLSGSDTLQLKLPVGTYTIKQLFVAKEYELKDMTIEGKALVGKEHTFTITKDHNTTILVKNEKVNKSKDKDGIDTGDATRQGIFIVLLMISGLLGSVVFKKSKGTPPSSGD